MVRIPKFVDEERLVLTLLQRDRVAIYPGYFFDFDDNGWLVISLLPPPEELELGVSRLIDRLEAIVDEKGCP